MGEITLTGFAENNYTDSNIANIMEISRGQVYHQIDKSWFDREEEKRWIVLSDTSSWSKNEIDVKNIKNSIYYI